MTTDSDKNVGGRPLVFATPEDLKKKVDEYFSTQTKWTLAGLAEFLDIDRQTLYNYKEKDGFIDILKKSREKVEAKYEERLVYDNAPTGVIFALKNMGWSDKTEMDVTSKGEQIQGFNYIPPSSNEVKEE